MRNTISVLGLILFLGSCEQPASIPTYQRAEPDPGPDAGPGAAPDAGTPDAEIPDAALADAAPWRPNKPEPRCGDGVWQADRAEACDDGNEQDGDGCSADCSIATCFVPATHASVQAGVDDASCGVIYVYSGYYRENVSVSRDLAIRGVGAAHSLIDGGVQGSVFSIRAGRVTLQRLIVQGGRAVHGGGVYFEGSELALVEMEIRDNAAVGEDAAGGGIYSVADALTLMHARVSGNYVGSQVQGRGGGIYSERGQTVLAEGSAVVDNAVVVQGSHAQVEAWGGGIFQARGWITLSGASVVSQNLVYARGVTSGEPEAAVAARGGGVALTGGSLQITGYGSVHGNHAESESSHRAEASGGGVFLDVAPGTSGEAAMLTLSLQQTNLIDNQISAHSTGDTQTSVSLARGGAIYAGTRYAAEAHLFVGQGSRISSNRADARATVASTAQGGGIYAVGEGAAPVEVVAADSIMSGNAALADGVAQGGASYVGAYGASAVLVFTIWRSTLSDNRAGAGTGSAEGGALRVAAAGDRAQLHFELANSTMSGNRSISSRSFGRGGAVSIARPNSKASVHVSIGSATVVQNLATTMGGGLDLEEDWQGDLAEIRVRNTILAENVAAVWRDCATSPQTKVTSEGYNLMTTSNGCHLQTGAGDLIGVEPRLGPLAWNGMPSRTHSLLADSPAIDAGDPNGCADAGGVVIETDQCGQARTGRCDIGAVEFRP